MFFVLFIALLMPKHAEKSKLVRPNTGKTNYLALSVLLIILRHSVKCVLNANIIALNFGSLL